MRYTWRTKGPENQTAMPILNSNALTTTVILLAASLALGADAPATLPAPPAPLSPEKAQAGFQIDPGLRMELVAAEPDVQSPVEIAFDEQGRLWVVEMPDYPNGPEPGAKPAGRVKILEDRDGDGRYEHVTVFAEGLLFANGILPWKDGALVTAAPEIALLRDTNGDGKSDERDPLYEGFTAGNPQLRVSHPTLGFDNWIYVSNGLRGGKAHRIGRPETEVFDLSGMDFRFDLIHDRAEAISGMGQYGLTFDRWGRRFVCDNSHHLRQIVLPNRYLKNNPFLAVPAVIQDVPEAERGQGGAGAKVYPLSKTWTTSSLHTGHFTAACSVTIYEGDLLPEAYRGAAFTCEPTGNLVHQEVLQPNGATFRSRPARDGVEFLATTDPWFRPVNLTVGPDGALYVVDMYRAVIEHPEFMPPELKTRPDLNLGKDRGRIWRIVPDGKTERASRPNLNKVSTPDLVAVLGHPNSWQRTTAQRLLLQRQDPKANEPLREVVRNSDRPLARLQAAWLLEGAKALDDDLLLGLLKDDEAGVREHAVRIAESRLTSSRAIQDQVLALADDPGPRVRFQVALSLGQSKDAKVLTSLAKVAL
ncbi:MAG: PVC-type heme-binding CxxCH protein, partial [Isosphaeraceae bacterium]